MSTIASQYPERAIFPTEPVFGLTVENYHDMIAAGILTTDDRVELLEGALICKMAKNPPHRIGNLKLQRALTAVLPNTVFPQYQEPITLARSEPEPDGAVIYGVLEDFPDCHPPAAAVALVVEVADSSLRLDRNTKRRIYGQAGIVEYWIVNLIDRVVEVHTNPTPAEDGYLTVAVRHPGESLAVVLRGQCVGEIAVADLLP